MRPGGSGLAVRLDAVCAAVLDAISARGWLGVLSLISITLVADLPGLLRLPPIDRTEVIYAESARQMLREGRLIDPRYLGEPERHRPIGAFWLQMAAAKIAGPAARDSISTYRLPSLLGVLTAVLATYLLLAGAAGRRVAWGAAVLTAISPVASLQAHLAITESVTFGPAVIAELALLRLYVDEPPAPTRGFALLMWVALGVGIALNALAAPILCVATLIALFVMDRDTSWLRRLAPAWGVPLMLLLASPWPIALVMAEGAHPFAGMSLNDILNLLGGSQAMKLRAWPGTFTLGLILACLPGVLLLWPALRGLWNQRDARLQRFLVAWLAGYLVYLELISSKPALYTVQVLLPAAACAVMLLLWPERDRSLLLPPRGGGREGGMAERQELGFPQPLAPTHVAAEPHVRGEAEGNMRWPERIASWPGLVFAAAYPVLVVVLHRLTHTPLTAAMITGALLVAVLMALPALAAHMRLAAGWLAATAAGFAAFLAFSFAVLLPSQKSAWTTEVIREAVAPLKGCDKWDDVAIVGYREPSAVFTFGAGRVFLSLGELVEAAKRTEALPRFIVAERADTAGDRLEPWPFASAPISRWCVEAFNVTRGCVQSFRVYDTMGLSTDLLRCTLDGRFACDAGNTPLSGAKRCR